MPIVITCTVVSCVCGVHAQVELTDCVSMLVGNNERVQAIISQLEETCRSVDVSSPGIDVTRADQCSCF